MAIRIAVEIYDWGQSMKLIRKIGDVVQRIFSYGILNTVGYSFYKISEIWHERKLGISSGGYVRRAELGLDASGNEYAPSPYSILFKVFNDLKIKPEEEVFLDYGSGMGRALVVAALYPFDKVVGVEFSDALNIIARNNIQQARRNLKCKNVVVITADAMNYLPSEEVTVFFLFNPFDNEILENVLAKIKASLVAKPREVKIIYQRGNGHDAALEKLDWLTRCRSYRSYYYDGCLREAVLYMSSGNHCALH